MKLKVFAIISVVGLTLGMLTTTNFMHSAMGAIGSATIKINTNIYWNSATEPSPNNKDMIFRLLVQQGSTSFYDQRLNGSPNTIIIPVPVAMSGKTDYQTMFVAPSVIQKNNQGYWGPGDESTKVCSGEIENGGTALCTLNMYWNYYTNK